jgi:DMSO/TMAO reductase YedYZ molybdopterin-dependent catalytic subunit
VAPDCSLSPVIAPTAAPNPGQTERDPSTGLHVTGRVQMLDLATYRLRVTGLVDRPLALTYDEIRCLPRIEDNPLLTCPRTFQDRTTWAGASLTELLELAGVQAGAEKVQFVSADGFKATLSLERALQPGNFLAYEWEGEPLPRLHGFPLRAVLPAEIGFYWVKWLVEIHVQ